MPQRQALGLFTALATVFLIVLGLAPTLSAASTETASFNAVADTYVSKSASKSNYGASSSLSVSESAYHALLRFDVVLPAGSTVSAVSLKVFSTSAVNSSLVVHPSGNAWEEMTVTYANQPGWQAAELSRTGPLSKNAYLTAALPASSISGPGPVSFGLNTTSRAVGSLASRETGTPPQLLVTYSPPDPAPSATPTASPTPIATATPTPIPTAITTEPSPTATATLTPTPTPTPSETPAFDHIVVVIFENKAYGNIIGNAGAPYINRLAESGANLTEMYAETHPSQPNYLDFFSGDNQGVVDNSGAPYQFTTENIAHQLIAAGKTFGAYAEGLPFSGYLGGDTNGYRIHHAPWVNWTNYPATVSHPFAEFPSDFTQLPTLAMVTPNNCNNMHDCSVATGDAWLSANLDGYAQWAKTNNSLLIVTWDEDDSSAANLIPTVFSGAQVVPGAYSQITNHYGLLGLIEDINRLPRIAHSIPAAPITAPFASTGPSPTATATATSSPSPDPTYIAPPSASFTANPAAGPAPLPVSFTDTSQGSPTSWSWDFGDGGLSTAQNPSHTYAAAGSYTARLTVTNPGGSTSASTTIAVQPGPAATSISVIGSTTTYSAASSTVSLTAPAGTLAGDVLVASITGDLNPTMSSIPAGWVAIVNGLSINASSTAGARAFAYYHVVDAADPLSYGWTLSSAVKWGGGVTAYRGVDNATPLDTPTATAVDASYTATSITVPGLTTSSNGTMLIGGAACDCSSPLISPPTGWTELWEAGGGQLAELADRTQASAGATGTATWTLGAARGVAAWRTALKPAG